MAHAYTTNRGKNKQSKLNKRMDNKQNQERKIKTNSQSESNQFANQQKEKFTIGHLSNSTINQQASIRNNNSNNRDINRQILDKKCLNPQCSNKDGKKSLLHCTGKLLILLLLLFFILCNH